METNTIDRMLDWSYGPDGDRQLQELLATGIDVNQRFGELSETPLHIAARRRRLTAVKILAAAGADLDAKNAGNKTAFAHAVRRGFDEIAELLKQLGASTELNRADELACAVTAGDLTRAKLLVADDPDCVRTGNPEEDRLLADVAGRSRVDLVEWLIAAGADLTARGLDDGTPLHQAAWFGQPDNARRLLAAGAPVNVFERVHQASPLGWAVHGSRYSGGADSRQPQYVELTEMLLAADSQLHYPDDPGGDRYRKVLLQDASDAVAVVLRRAFGEA